MKIGISGTHGTGKTTFALKLAYQMKLENPKKTIKLITETADDCPFPIFKKGYSSSIDAQLWIFSHQIKLELEASRYDIIVTDRTLYDVIAYTMMIDMDIGYDMLSLMQHFKYDVIYFSRVTAHNFMYDDKRRDTDTKFREDIDHRLGELLLGDSLLEVRETKIHQID